MNFGNTNKIALAPYGINTDTWIISDTHFFHQNIGTYCNRPENWQEMIIQNWNNCVSSGEIVLHLGDFAFGKKHHFVEMVDKLNGKLLLIQGNHDRFSQAFCQSNGVTLINHSIQFIFDFRTNILFSHYPIVPLEDGWINIHGHIHNTPPPSEGSNLGSNHINMSVEVRGYHPWKLRDILGKELKI